VDSDGVTHAFGDVDDGELLEIFVEGSPEYGLYEVVGQAHDETQGATSFWVIDVNFIRTLEDTSTVAPGETCRFKIFMAPTGGNASDFVLKAGDTMTGELEFYHEQAGSGANYDIPPVNTKDIRFSTKNTDGGASSIVHFYQPGYSNVLMSSGSLMARSALYTGSYLYATSFNSDGTRTTKNPRIYFTTTEGTLRWGTSTDILTWNGTQVVIPKTAGNSTSRTGFTIKGATSTGYGSTVANQNGDLLKVEHVGTYADRVQYFGRIATDNDIATKKYVDDKAGVAISCSSSGRSVGDLWYCSTDQVMYLKVS
jgi:hypothetical protein